MYLKVYVAAQSSDNHAIHALNSGRFYCSIVGWRETDKGISMVVDKGIRSANALAKTDRTMHCTCILSSFQQKPLSSDVQKRMKDIIEMHLPLDPLTNPSCDLRHLMTLTFQIVT